MTRDQILATLPKLTQADRGAISAALVSLRGGEPQHSPQQLSATQQAFFDALLGIVGRRAATLSGLPVKQFAKRSPDAVAFIETHFHSVLKNRVQRGALMRHMANLIAADLKALNVPVTLGTLTNNVGRLGEIWERAYPDYLTGGLGQLLVKQILRSTK